MKNSTFGTFVNGDKLGAIEIRKLQDRDIITFSGFSFPLLTFMESDDEEEHPTGSYDFDERFK